MDPEIQLLSDLVAIASVNPSFQPDDPSNAVDESEIANFLEERLKAHRIEVERQPVAPNRDNLIARLKPSGRIENRLALVPHMDTVRLESEEQLVPTIRDSKLYGRGACDTKGSIAAMTQALIRLAQAPNRPKNTEILLALMVDEEYAQGGSRKFAQSGISIDLAIVGEPTELRAVTAHKGALWMKARTLGRSAHGARPKLGHNAIYDMARFVQYLASDYQERLEENVHARLGAPTLSVGQIHGGAQPNIVPESCEIIMDRRTVPGETDAAILSDLADALKRLGVDGEIEDIKGLQSPPLDTDPTLPEVQRFLSVLHDPRPIGVDFFCDGAILGAANIPSVVFGPGSIDQAHTKDEWVECDQVSQACSLLYDYIRSAS